MSVKDSVKNLADLLDDLLKYSEPAKSVHMTVEQYRLITGNQSAYNNKEEHEVLIFDLKDHDYVLRVHEQEKENQTEAPSP